MMRANPLIKLLAIPLLIIIFGILLLSYVTHHFVGENSHNKTTFVNDKASSDTPVETLKTLTSEISSVEQQNQKIIAQNKALSSQDKTTLAQFKNSVMLDVQKQMEKFKADAQNQVTAKNNTLQNNDTNLLSQNMDTLPADTNPWMWVNDMQNNAADANTNTHPASSSSLGNLSSLLNPALKESTDQKVEPSHGLLLSDTTPKTTKMATPFYTIPVNATLTGAIAMQPIIGRIPISGKVPDPYTFKVIIGPKNLAANGIDIPEDIQGIVASGIAEGDLLGRCARGDIYSMTFIFQDGRISTTETKDGQRLGTIAAANGNPCLQGSFHTDAPLFLSVTAGLAGLQGYSNALSQTQLNNSVTSTGESISTLIGSANRYAAGQGFSAASQAAQTWWNQRVENSFDFVYVPNVDPKTGEKLKLNINITQEIAIDYDSTKRKVFYAHDKDVALSYLD